MSFRAALLAAVFAAAPTVALAASASTELPSGQFITPTAAAGATFTTLNPGLADHPDYRAGQAVKAVVSPDGTTLLVLTSGYNNLNYTSGPNAGNLEPSASTEYVFVYDITNGHEGKPALTQVIQVPDTYVGLVFAPGGGTFYVSGGVNDEVLAYGLANGAWSLSATIPLGHPAGIGFEQPPTVAGLALSASGDLLATANIYNDSISIVDTAAGKIIADYDLRPYNTTPATGNGVAGGETPFGVAIKGETTLYVSSMRDREIVVLDISAVPAGGAPVLITRIPVSGNPNSLLLSNDAAQSRLYVAEDNSDSVAVINTATNKKLEEIPAAAPPGLLTGESYSGAAPNGLALSPDGNLLYVTEGGADAVAVIAVGANQPHQVWGLIPTGWYPNSVALGLAGGYIYVVNGKSLPGPNKLNPGDNTGALPNAHNEYIYQLEQAGLLALPAPAPRDLPALSNQVATNNNWTTLPNGHDQAVMQALHDRIHHIIYIVKENRTFDQVLGDLHNGSNGEPALALYGRRLTPNFHRISDQFVTLDNFYCAGEVSGDGWHWSLEARESDMATKTIPLNYASSPTGGGRGAPYDSEGYNRDIMVGIPSTAGRESAEPLYGQLTAQFPGGTANLLPGDNDDAAADGPDGLKQQGYLWSAVLRSGQTVRNYGFFIDGGRYELLPPEIPLDPTPYANHDQQAFSMTPELINRTDIYFRGFDNAYPDIWREQEWEREFNQFTTDGDLPALSLVRLMHDHTGSFGQAVGGINTPELDQADNDYSVGLLVQAIANSPHASDTLVFVLEDDAQAGPDHVDAHRSTAYIVGPYVKQGAIVSDHYSTVSMLRTIEDILGTDHLNLIDAHTRPMTDVFDLSQKTWSYKAVASPVLKGTSGIVRVPGAKFADGDTPKLLHDAAWWSAHTAGIDFHDADHLPANYARLEWEGVTGTVYPADAK